MTMLLFFVLLLIGFNNLNVHVVLCNNHFVLNIPNNFNLIMIVCLYRYSCIDDDSMAYDLCM